MEIALNKESQRKTPSAIAFRDGDRIYGEDALNIGLRFPGNSFSYILDLLGKTVDNPVVDLYKYVVFMIGIDEFEIDFWCIPIFLRI